MAQRLLALLALAASLALAAAAAAPDPTDDPTLLRMGPGAKRISKRIVERPLNLEQFRENKEADGAFTAPPTPFEHAAGYFALNRTSAANMFYFYFKSRGDPSTDPVVLWMTGGPGCSSELAVFYENGPYSINADLSLAVTPHGWDTVSNLIYVDQPINTGFSYSTDPADDVHDEKRVAEDMLQFLSEFVQAHPELDGNDFYITGESYAGHYVPAVSYRVFRAQQEGAGPGMKLKGFAIGNGLTMPEIQYGAYGDYARGMDVVDKAAADAAAAVYPACAAKVRKCGGGAGKEGPAAESKKRAAACLDAVDFCEAIPGGLLQAAGDINVYDVRKHCVGSLCYDFSNAETFLNQPAVRAALGVGDRKWEMCSGKVHSDMMADWMRNLEPVVPPMLEAGLRVMIYAGEDDFICNWLGNRRWVRAMEWSGQAAFNATLPVPFVVDGVTGGDVIESGLLSFVKMSESGHMVPMDQPKNAVTMLQRFITGVPIAGAPWETSTDTPKTSSSSSSAAKLTLVRPAAAESVEGGDAAAAAAAKKEPRRAMGSAAA
mmetsp:Transcript_30744/g.76505  ORF Transcript_30744/g.76505 Transcript_30744/m.76505 type:complete len:546 (+) Transcript_30744:27-1664(+)